MPLLSRACTAIALAATTLVASPAYADAAHDPTVFCSTYTRAASVLVYVGYATTPSSHTPPLALTVTCTYTGDNGTFVGSNTTPGPISTTAGSALIGVGDVTVCGSATALYADGHVGTAPQQCEVIPSLPVTLPDITDVPLVDPQAPQCASERVQVIGTNVAGFLLIAVASGPVRTVPATSSNLRCTLYLTTGAVVTAANNTPAAFGVPAQYIPAPFAPISRKCTTFSVNYAEGPQFADPERCV